MTTPPRRPTAALQRLAGRTGIQHGQLGADLHAALGYLNTLEHEAHEHRRVVDQLAEAVHHALEHSGSYADLVQALNQLPTITPPDRDNQ